MEKSIDAHSQKRNRNIIVAILVINLILQFIPFVLVGNFSPSAEQLGYITGRYLASSLIYLLGYYLGRGKLKPAFEENQKKFSKGIWVSFILSIFMVIVFIQNSISP